VHVGPEGRVATFYRQTVMPGQWPLWGLGIAIGIVFVFVYARVMCALVIQWSSNDVYSYGFLIPVISAYLIWVRRDRVIGLRWTSGSIGGGLVVATGLGLLLAGHVGSVMLLQEFSLLLSLVGLIWFIFGWPYLRVLWFPIAYLLFMIPIWEIALDRLHGPFQWLTTRLAVQMLHALSIPVYASGTLIELRHVTLEVAKVCSGVNYAVAVVALAVPLAYLFIQGWRRRTGLVVFALVVAVLSNSVRVALIGVVAHAGIGADIHGPFHVLRGLFVSIIGYGAIFGGLWLLSSQPARSIPAGPFIDRLPLRAALAPATGIPVSVLCVVGVYLVAGWYLYTYHPTPVPLKEPLKELPRVLDVWTGRDAAFDDLRVRLPGSDEDLARTYRALTGEEVELYIAYYEDQAQGKEMVSYLTKDLDAGASPVTLDMGSVGTVTVNEVVRSEGGRRSLMLYWYDLNGHTVTNRFVAKAYTTWQAMTLGRTNGALIILRSPMADAERLPAVRSRTLAFARAMLPSLHDRLPSF